MNNVFIAKGVYIGGVYPFRISSPHNIYKFALQASEFIFDESDKYEYVSAKRAIYGTNHKWANPAKTLIFETELNSLILSDKSNYENLKIITYISIYNSGFCSIIFGIDLEKHELTLQQVIELTSICKGTSAVINRSEKPIININFLGEILELNNLIQFCELIEKRLKYILEEKESLDHVQFIYPITYIYELADCKDSNEIINKYSKEISSISDTWIYYYPYLKDINVERIISTDFHPFTYGLSIFSNTGMVEIHPSNFNELYSITKYDTQKQHFLEKIYLSIQCEIPVVQLFILKWLDVELNSISFDISSKKYNLYFFIKKLFKANSLYNNASETLNQFRDVHFSSKSYIPYAIENIQNKLGILKFQESINQKLNNIQQQLTTAYSMVTTILVIILTIFGLLFAILQTYGTFSQIGTISKNPVKQEIIQLRKDSVCLKSNRHIK